MAWTSPGTAVANAVIASAFWNTNVRDNMLQTAPAILTTNGQTVFSTAANTLAMVPARIYKTADQTINNSTTLTNDTHLLLPMAANDQWAFRMMLYFTNASGAPGYKFAFTVPAGATGWLDWEYDFGTVGASFSAGIRTILDPITTGNAGSLGASQAARVVFKGYVANSTTPGNLQFQWAQNAAVVSNTILKLGSHLIPTRLV